MVRDGKVTGRGVPAAPRGGGPVPGLQTDRVEEVHRPASGQQVAEPGDPLGVESRPAMMDVTTFERPWPAEIVNDGSHGQIAPPDHASEGEQDTTAVYPVAPIHRSEPASWADPLIMSGGPAPEGEPIPGVT